LRDGREYLGKSMLSKGEEDQRDAKHEEKVADPG
jgi:hypothetical protein